MLTNCASRLQAIFFRGTKAGNPEGQNRPILSARVANENTGFASSRASHEKNWIVDEFFSGKIDSCLYFKR